MLRHQNEDAIGMSPRLAGLLHHRSTDGTDESTERIISEIRSSGNDDRQPMGWSTVQTVVTTAPCPPTSFGERLRHYRSAAGLTQEELAERTQLSVRGLSDLERSINRRPRRDTIQALVDALHLSGGEETAFRAAARPVPAAIPGYSYDSAADQCPCACLPTVRTVLIADIRGYTRYLVEQGNDAGAALAMRFAALAALTIEP